MPTLCTLTTRIELAPGILRREKYSSTYSLQARFATSHSRRFEWFCVDISTALPRPPMVIRNVTDARARFIFHSPSSFTAAPSPTPSVARSISPACCFILLLHFVARGSLFSHEDVLLGLHRSGPRWLSGLRVWMDSHWPLLQNLRRKCRALSVNSSTCSTSNL